jgi:hypothetical protein
MPVTHRKGPLPDGHPLKGTRIFFGNPLGIPSKAKLPSERSERKELPNEWDWEMFRKSEEALKDLFPISGSTSPKSPEKK